MLPAPSIVLSLVKVLLVPKAKKDVLGDMTTFPEPVRVVGWVKATKYPLVFKAIVPVSVAVNHRSHIE
jgi:hypothetical protein